MLELPDGKEAALKAKAQAQGVSAEQYYGAKLQQQGLPLLPARDQELAPRISEKIRKRMQNIPAEAWAALPADGASEHDHYIYGLPKRSS